MRKVMKILVISGYDVIREGVTAILSRQEHICVEFASESAQEVIPIIESSKVDIALVCIDREEQLSTIYEIKRTGANIKLIIFDFKGDNKLFISALKYGVEGYILGRANEGEIVYALHQISRGRKYYDSYFVDRLVDMKKPQPERLELLTPREKEILRHIAGGLNNRKICEQLAISENTVKKHISHIFEKLKLKDRTEAALYVNKYGIR